MATALAVELGEECRNRPRICYALLRRDNAPAAPGCRTPGIRGDAEICKGGAGAARAAVNLALTLHGLTEACSLTCLLDEESCSQVCGIFLTHASRTECCFPGLIFADKLASILKKHPSFLV